MAARNKYIEKNFSGLSTVGNTNTNFIKHKGGNMLKLGWLLFIGLAFLTCSTTQFGYIGHSINTQVILDKANFTVIETVEGRASAEYLIGIGPKDQDLFAKARFDMIKSAKLKGTSKAIINISTDIKRTTFLFPLWYEKTIYVCGEVIEFHPDSILAK